METLFEDCIGGVVELLESQTKKLREAKGRKPRVSESSLAPVVFTPLIYDRTSFLLVGSVHRPICNITWQQP